LGQPYQYAGAPVAETRKVASSVRLLRLNRLGFAGAAVGVGSWLFDPFFITSILAIVLCSIGLSNDAKLRGAGHRSTGRGWIIAGLVLGIAKLLLYAIFSIAPFVENLGSH
jgi:hypothetical protein